MGHCKSTTPIRESFVPALPGTCAASRAARFEFQQAPPVFTAATATPAEVLTGQPVSFSGTGTDPNGEPVTFGWARTFVRTRR